MIHAARGMGRVVTERRSMLTYTRDVLMMIVAFGNIILCLTTVILIKVGFLCPQIMTVNPLDLGVRLLRLGQATAHQHLTCVCLPTFWNLTLEISFSIWHLTLMRSIMLLQNTPMFWQNSRRKF